MFVTDRFGKANKALFLNVGYVQINPASASIYLVGETTISYWAYLVAAQSFCPRIFQCGTKSVNSIELLTQYPADQWATYNLDQFFYINNGSNPIGLSANIHTIYGQWVHRAVILQHITSNSTYVATLYTNGTSTGSVTQPPANMTANNLSKCTIGYSWWGDPNVYGYIDDFFIFQRALIFSELKSLMTFNE